MIQIYEVQGAEEAEAVLALGVNCVGSVLLSESGWRIPGLRRALEAVRAAGGRSSLIPLFGSLDVIRHAADYYRPDVLHFCDALVGTGAPDGLCGRLIEMQIRVKEAFPEVALMRSIPVGPPGASSRIPSLELARRFLPATDIFLVDTLRPGDDGPGAAGVQPVPGFVGITGTACDWDVARRLVETAPIPVILAGGLSAHNVAEAIGRVGPAGVDSCTLTNAVGPSGEPIRFKKDLGKVRDFVAAVRRVDKEIQERSGGDVRQQ
jgi:phosphoribosylanthranilate isomerase